MPSRRTPLLALALFFAGACTSVPETGADAGPGEVDPWTQLTDVYQAGTGPFEVPGFTEVYKCAVLRMDNPDPLLLTRYRADMLPGSHHFNLLYVPEGSYGEPGVYEGACDMFSTVPVWFAGSQWPEVDEPLPPETYVNIPARSDLLLDIHYINTTAEPIDGQVDVRLGGVHPNEAGDELGTYFNFLMGFRVPPQTTQTWAARFAVKEGSQVFLMTSHAHWQNTRFEIFRYREGSPDLESLYVSTDPLHPQILRRFDDPIVFGKSEGFEVRCTWANTLDTPLRFGESGLEDEMCIMAAFYTPTGGLAWLYGQQDGWVVRE